MAPDQSLISLFTNASLLVKLVMLLLLAASVVSWTLIFQRWKTFKIATESNDEFEETFWSGMEISKLYQKYASKRQGEVSGSESIFLAGFKEFIRLRKQTGIQATAVMEGAQRAMRVAMAREVEHLEMHLPFLATVGSISPYVGLFGTVWGIMNSFRALGTVQQATLAMVAPGISEALVATAMGLFAAIPAVIAYNRYSNRLQSLENRYDAFLEEFTSILHRQAYTKPESHPQSSFANEAESTSSYSKKTMVTPLSNSSMTSMSSVGRYIEPEEEYE